MNILVILDRMDNLGGAELHVLNQVNELSKRGHNVYLYTNAISQYFKDKLNKEVNLISPWSGKPLEDIGDLKFDIVHSHPFVGIVYGLEIVNKLNCKFIVTMHGLYNYGFDNSDFGRKLGKRVNKVIAVDDISHEILFNSPNCPKNKLMKIYNGVNLLKYSGKKKKVNLFTSLGFNKNYKTISVITRFDDGKEIPPSQLVKVLPKISENLGGLNVVFVGGGKKSFTIEDEIKKINSENLNVKYVGSVDDVEEYINISDLVCGSARVAIEAICCGKNVFQMGIEKWGVLVDKTNYKDTVFNTKYYTNYTDDELVRHISWFINQKEDIDKMNEGLSEIIKTECDLNNVTDKLIKVYEGEI
jgi:glycosyltransferase involved in cell wall biosynthesis